MCNPILTCCCHMNLNANRRSQATYQCLLFKATVIFKRKDCLQRCNFNTNWVSIIRGWVLLLVTWARGKKRFWFSPTEHHGSNSRKLITTSQWPLGNEYQKYSRIVIGSDCEFPQVFQQQLALLSVCSPKLMDTIHDCRLGEQIKYSRGRYMICQALWTTGNNNFGGRISFCGHAPTRQSWSSSLGGACRTEDLFWAKCLRVKQLQKSKEALWSKYLHPCCSEHVMLIGRLIVIKVV